MTFNKVDFPDPEGPIIETKSPSLISKLMSFKIKFLALPTLYHLNMCSNFIMFFFIVFSIKYLVFRPFLLHRIVLNHPILSNHVNISYLTSQISNPIKGTAVELLIPQAIHRILCCCL